MKKARADMTQAEADVRDRERKIKRIARDIQRRLDRDVLYAKLPEIVTAMIGASDREDVDESVIVEYKEAYDYKLMPMATIVIRTEKTYFHEEQLIALLGVARALGMTGTIHAAREDNYNGDREMEFSLRPVSSKIGEPSAEAIAEATMRFTAEEAANAS